MDQDTMLTDVLGIIRWSHRGLPASLIADAVAFKWECDRADASAAIRLLMERGKIRLGDELQLVLARP